MTARTAKWRLILITRRDRVIAKRRKKPRRITISIELRADTTHLRSTLNMIRHRLAILLEHQRDTELIIDPSFRHTQEVYRAIRYMLDQHNSPQQQ